VREIEQSAVPHRGGVAEQLAFFDDLPDGARREAAPSLWAVALGRADALGLAQLVCR
jgi:hypothetical protein